MNSRIAILQKGQVRKCKNYHEEGTGTITILVAIATVAVILCSVFFSLGSNTI